MKYLDLAIANETIKTTDIKGKEYAEVNQRIKAFRMVYPQGFIRTKIVELKDGVCTMNASVGYYEIINNESIEYELGTGTAYEKEDSSFINKTSYIENCETSAVGRALGMAGFGIDVSVASAEEVQNAMQNQEPTQEEAEAYTLTFGKYKGQTLKEVFEKDEGYIQWMINNSQDEHMLKIISMATGIYIPSEEESNQRLNLVNSINGLVIDTDTDYEEIYKHFGVKGLNELTIAQLKECEQILGKKYMKQEGEYDD